MTRRDRPPAVAAARATGFPAVHRARAGGGDLWLVEQAASPVVAISLVTAAGAAREPEALAGLASLCAALLDEGTAQHDSSAIARRIEGLGGSLGAGAGWDAANLSADFLAHDLAAGLELLAEIALQPSFPRQEIERLRAQRLAEIRRRADRPGTMAEEALLRAIYGPHGYGRFVNGGTDSVTRISRDDLATFHRAEWLTGRRRPTLLIVGDVRPGDALREAERVLADWPARAAAPIAHAHAPLPAGNKVVLIDRPEGAQTELRIGHAGPPRNDPDFSTLQVLMTLLGGKFTSRLNLNLRERHGLTYGAAARWSQRRGHGPITLSAAVATESAGLAAREALHEVARLREEPVPEAELAETRDYLRGVFPYTLQTSEDVLRHLEDLVIFDLEPDEIAHHLERVAAVTSHDLLDCARRHLRPEEAIVVAVGPARRLRDQFPDSS